MILVTGGAGFIGSNFLHLLKKKGYAKCRIVCVDKLTYASNYDTIKPLIENGFIEFIGTDIASDDMSKVIEFYKPQYIVNFAAETHVDNSIENHKPFIDTNIIGTINLLDKCRNQKQLRSFVHVSTDEVYGSLGLDDNSFTENTPYNPNSPYSASKASSDHFVRVYKETYGVPTIITNCSNNYGPSQHKEKLVPKIIYNAMNDIDVPIYGDGSNIRDWLYVEDHCEALRIVMEKGRIGEKYNIGGGVEVSNLELTKMILDILGKPHSLIKFVDDRLGHDFRYSINYDKIKSELGYKPKYDLVKGLEKTIEWSKHGS